MPLTLANISAGLAWTLTKTVTGFNAITDSDSSTFSLTPNVSTFTEPLTAQYTLAASGTQVVDLRSFTDKLGTAVTATKALALLILVTGAAADKLNVKPDASDGLVWPFENVGYGVNIPGGGCLLFSEGASSAGFTIDGTHKELLLTNTGSASLTVTVVAFVG